MADPTIQAFCCHKRSSSLAEGLITEIDKDQYIIVCLVSSVIGMFGAIYQIFIRKEPGDTNDEATSKNLGRKIIVCLAYSDLFASVGIFVRSALWRFVYLTPIEDDTHSILFCSLSSAWVQFFYTATWLWTLSYALNMRRALLNKSSLEREYHFFVWTTSTLLTAVGCGVLYLPNADCHDIYDLETALLRVLPNYIMSYGPIIVIMIVNPILYNLSCKEVDKQLVSRFNQYTKNERSIMDMFRIKFSLINLIFYVCWLPNIVNGVLIWTMWFNIPVKVMIVTWYLEAILNPLQAFLNCLVYRKWTNRNSLKCAMEKLCSCFKRDKERVMPHRDITEATPLLQLRPSFSRNFGDQSNNEDFHRHSVNACSCV